MQADLIGLKLVLDHLGVPIDTAGLDNRKRLQKVVYLSQAAGVDLGYRFSWYLMGPYSSALTRDYFSFEPRTEHDAGGYRLTEQVTEALSQVEPLLNPPADVPLAQAAWLELVASLLFLQRDSKRDQAAAFQFLHETKPALRPYADNAQGALNETGLM